MLQQRFASSSQILMCDSLFLIRMAVESRVII